MPYVGLLANLEELVAVNIARALTGEELPLAPVDWPDLGEGFDLTDDLELQRRYPRLYARFRDDDLP